MEKLKQGDKFCRLTVLGETKERLNRSILYKCKCECGNVIFTTSTRLKGGHVKSCGCLQKENASIANKTHGESRSKLYYVWQDMKKRCSNKKHHAYKDYGGRGITVCKAWNESFLSFYKWSIKNGYKEGLTIDRKNNDDGYYPDNCRWVTMKIQSKNRRKKNIELSKNPHAKSVNMYSLDGKFIKTYNTIKEACADNNIKGTGTCISACCRGKQEIAHGYIWRYANT